MNKIISILVVFLCVSTFLKAQTTGQLTVATTTSSAGGNYAPRNIVAIWVEDAEGNFVKTLLAYAQSRRTHLNTWQASTQAAGTEYNVVDAITGSTRSSHGTRNCTWNATDYNGNTMADGTYSVWMELTDRNGTGNFSSFSFEKGPDVVNLTPADMPSFASITIDWQPDGGVSISEVSRPSPLKLSPNPTSGQLTVAGVEVLRVKICNMAGEVLLETVHSQLDISALSSGIYLVVAESAAGTHIQKVVKK